MQSDNRTAIKNEQKNHSLQTDTGKHNGQTQKNNGQFQNIYNKSGMNECEQRGGGKQQTKNIGGSGLNISAILGSIIPSSVYNPNTKKVFGILTSEDLLLIALIFLFAENSEECDPLLIPALIYILLSDYIDLPELSF